MDEKTFYDLLSRGAKYRASDAIFKVGQPPAFRVTGALRYLQGERMRPEHTQALLLERGGSQRGENLRSILLVGERLGKREFGSRHPVVLGGTGSAVGIHRRKPIERVDRPLRGRLLRVTHQHAKRECDADGGERRQQNGARATGSVLDVPLLDPL